MRRVAQKLLPIPNPQHRELTEETRVNTRHQFLSTRPSATKSGLRFPISILEPSGGPEWAVLSRLPQRNIWGLVWLSLAVSIHLRTLIYCEQSRYDPHYYCLHLSLSS